MTRRRLGNYLRTHRQKWGLSQRELAELLSVSKQTVSKYELEQLPVSGRLIVAAELIFGVPYPAIFPAFCEAVEDSLGARALVLYRKLEGRDDAPLAENLEAAFGIAVKDQIQGAMNASAANKGLVLAVHPTRGFGWVVFESPLSPVDWGIASAREGRNARLLARFERLLKRYDPTVLVLEEFDGRAASRVERVQQLCRNMRHLAACRGIETPVYSRAVIRTVFVSIGATTRYEIAQAIAQRIDALSHRLPRYRKPWLAQDSRQSLFDAAALALTFFAVTGDA